MVDKHFIVHNSTYTHTAQAYASTCNMVWMTSTNIETSQAPINLSQFMWNGSYDNRATSVTKIVIHVMISDAPVFLVALVFFSVELLKRKILEKLCLT